MLRKILFLTFLGMLVGLTNGIAQSVQKDTLRPDIAQDIRIRELMARKVMMNEKNKGTLKGFRVQIYSGAERDKAKEIKSKFLQKFPEALAYDLYELPNFKVRTGDFRTKLEAQRFLKTIVPDFPDAFVVQSEIEMPAVD